MAIHPNDSAPQVDDPGFAANLTFAATNRRRRRRAWLARGGLWAAAVVMLTGVGVAADALAAGVSNSAFLADPNLLYPGQVIRLG